MPVEWTALVGPLLMTLSRVAAAAGSAQRYRRKCQLLEHRVHLISDHVRALEKSRWSPDPPATRHTLEVLQGVLNRAESQVASCQRKKKAFDFLKAFRNTGEFSFVNQQIDHVMESFHFSNRNLLLGLYSDGIFMVVLDTLVGDGACRRLSQEKKEMLETRMDGLPYSDDNMSPEKIKMLESIRRELKQGSDWRRQWDDARSSSSAYYTAGAARTCTTRTVQCCKLLNSSQRPSWRKRRRRRAIARRRSSGWPSSRSRCSTCCPS